MTTVVSDLNLLGGNLPSRSAIGFLDPEISGEGQKITMDESQAEVMGIPPEKLSFPDFSKIKSLRKYFNRTGFQVYPAWIHHPSKPAVLVKTEAEAAEYGVSFRRTTPEERAAYGVSYKWDHTGEWRSAPYSKGKKRTVDPDNLETGKVYVPRVSRSEEQSNLIEALIPQVAAAVAAALKIAAPTTPEKVDPSKWARFQEFLAFEESAKAVTEAVTEPVEPNNMVEDEPSGVIDPNADEKTIWTAEAERMGIKVDKRWGIDRLKEECHKAA